MTSTTTEKADTTELIDRLAAHRTIGHAPRPELSWLATHGELRQYQAGESAFLKIHEITHLNIILTGHLAIYVDRGTGRRKAMEWWAGDAAGLLPYSRMIHPPGDSFFEEPSEVVSIHRDLFPDLIRECPTVTATFVHIMLDRARQFTSTDLHDE